MDEQKTDDLEEFFDLNQEQAEEDEKNESRNEDVDRVPQCCTTHTPGGKVKIAIAPGKTDITPYMASLGIISLEAYMELEAKKKARENVNTTQETKRAEREAEFMQVVEDNNNNGNAEANGAAPKRVGRMKSFRRFLQRVFCCSG
uniref:Uncharacterized protein n=1 Tax=Magallana gigas TaxID=29159 RepID=A0A8W8JH22_MAGGI